LPTALNHEFWRRRRIRTVGGKDRAVAIQRLNPSELHKPPGYHHVTIVDAGRTAHLAGQCPLDADGRVVGQAGGNGALVEQVDQIVHNALVVLAAVGATPEHVIRSVIYVVGDDQAVLGKVWTQLTGSALGAAFTSASTLLGVSQLGFPGQRVEVDLTAALS
jgi:enamine deaminase RidA (YjgF/YER057c/UK114 family)